MHEKKKFSLKKKLTTTSLLGPRISCHFCISSSSSKGVSFIPWKTQYKVLVLYTKQHERQICDKQLTASNATSISNYLQSTNVVFETPPPPKKLPTAPVSVFPQSASQCGPDNNNPYLSDVCPVSLLVYLKKNPSLLPCLSSVS